MSACGCGHAWGCDHHARRFTAVRLLPSRRSGPRRTILPLQGTNITQYMRRMAWDGPCAIVYGSTPSLLYLATCLLVGRCVRSAAVRKNHCDSSATIHASPPSSHRNWFCASLVCRRPPLSSSSSSVLRSSSRRARCSRSTCTCRRASATLVTATAFS